MKLNPNDNPVLQDNLINNPDTSFFRFLRNTERNNQTPWDERREVVKERTYHFATKLSDKMTVATAAEIFDHLKNDPISVSIFLHGLTGDYRDPQFEKGAMRAEIATADIIRLASKEYQPNDPALNTHLLKRIEEKLGYDPLEFASEKDKAYMKERMLPKAENTDSKETTADKPRIVWEERRKG